MATIWCKVCGEALEPAEGSDVSVCKRCGARQALPFMTNNEYLEQYAELVRLQQGGEHDSALELLEALLADGGNDAVLYWAGVLAAYKAVYHAEETGYTLSCGDANSVSVPDNDLYHKVLELASPAQRDIFEDDGILLENARLKALDAPREKNEDEAPLNRGFLFLEDGAWDAAAAQFDRAIADSPENALAYFGRMMAELQVYRESELLRVGTRLTEAPSYSAVQKYGDEMLLLRLKKYREEGTLYQAAELGKCAETIDEWKHIKKLLMDIIENDRAKEYISLCERKIRSIMSREAQLVIGCREAVNLGITTENLGTRMVSASYYYDFDMSAAAVSEKKPRQKVSPSRVMAIIALCVLILLVVLFAVSYWFNKDETAEVTYSPASLSDVNNNNTDVSDVTAESEEAKEENPLCIAGARAFILEDGMVRSFTEVPVTEVHEETQNGASFSINVTPYASDWNTWEDVVKLYNDPDGAMLFAVMENGTVSYDIFTSSDMNYEDTYRAVSAWRGVTELVWETGTSAKPCLFALTKDGGLYASNAVVEEKVLKALDPIFDDGMVISEIKAQNGSIHMLLEDGSYISVVYGE